MKPHYIALVAAAFLAACSFSGPARAQIDPPPQQPCQWNYTFVSNVATATYCGIVQSAGGITFTSVPDIATMVALPSPIANQAVDVGGVRGGIFIFTVTPCTTDNGTLFPPTVGVGCWQRQYNGALHAVWFSGADMGAQINAAYAASPVWATEIDVDSPVFSASKQEWNFSTPIVFGTIDKCPSLTGVGTPSQTKGGVILNYTPTTATTALTIDCVNASNGNGYPQSPLRNITLFNNDCVTTGGCGSSAVAIATGSTNAGDLGAVYDRIAVQGFGTVYKNHNQFAVNETFQNDAVYNNRLVFEAGTTAGQIGQQIRIISGVYAANSKLLNLPATFVTGLELNLSGGVSVFDNTGDGIIDCTNATVLCLINSTDTHYETSPSITNAHFIVGCFGANIVGGLMEYTKSASATDWMVHPTCNRTNVNILGTSIFSSSTLSEVLNADGLTTGFVQAFLTSANITAVVGGSPSQITDFSQRASGTASANNIVPVTTFQNGVLNKVVGSLATVQAAIPCNSGNLGAMAIVTDALGPAKGTPITGGGGVFTSAICLASNWYPG